MERRPSGFFFDFIRVVVVVMVVVVVVVLVLSEEDLATGAWFVALLFLFTTSDETEALRDLIALVRVIPELDTCCSELTRAGLKEQVKLKLLSFHSKD
jgi:hypothetical protein